MELFFSTDDFVIKGVPYKNFPILVDKDMEIFLPAFHFLIHHCIKRGRCYSVHSWRAYGQTLYDYFSFLEANNLKWQATEETVNSIVAYRDWSAGELKLKSSTVNYRLRFIILFYRYALKQRWIDTLPFEDEEVFVGRSFGFLAHTHRRNSVKHSPDVLLKDRHEPFKVLTKGQIQVFLKAIRNPTQKLMARLALQTGLRKQEIISYPTQYVPRPDTKKRNQLYVVELNPSDIKLKGNKPRTIHLPHLLVEDLWDYLIFDRTKFTSDKTEHSSVLFLNHRAEPYGDKALNTCWKRLKLDFKVTPHILRHTYATHMLHCLREHKHHSVEPLIYLRDRLGHSSIKTTEKYLHYLPSLSDQLMTSYQQEIDSCTQGS